jgi:hypothetical protein
MLDHSYKLFQVGQNDLVLIVTYTDAVTFHSPSIYSSNLPCTVTDTSQKRYPGAPSNLQMEIGKE